MAKQNVDIKWLLTGEGEMFMDREKVSPADQETSPEVSDLKDELIQSLKAQVSLLEDILERNDH